MNTRKLCIRAVALASMAIGIGYAALAGATVCNGTGTVTAHYGVCGGRADVEGGFFGYPNAQVGARAYNTCFAATAYGRAGGTPISGCSATDYPPDDGSSTTHTGGCNSIDELGWSVSY